VDSAEEWKGIYRLDMTSSTNNPKAPDEQSNKVTLNLFARVKNPTKVDWHQIRLALVANCLELAKKVQTLFEIYIMNAKLTVISLLNNQ